MFFHGALALERRKPLRAKPRSKGNRAELEVREILREHGYTSSRRNFQSGGQGGGDLIEAIPGFHLEVKHHERCAIWEWIAQAEAGARPTETPTVVFRRNRAPWMACLPLSDLMPLTDSDSWAWWDERSIYVETDRIRLWDRIEEAKAKGLDFVLFRRLQSRWYACVPFEDLLGLIEAAA